MRRREILALLKEAIHEWSEDKAPTLGAALAYFTLFSLAPLLVIAISVAGFFLGQQAASGQIYEQIRSVVGSDSARAIEGMVASANKPAAGIIGTVVGTVTLLLGAAGVFGQLKESMNIIWEAKPKQGGGVKTFVKDKFLSFTMVLGVGFLLLVSLVLSALLSAFAGVLGETFPVLWPVLRVVNALVSLAGITVLFALIFKVLPDVDVAWRDVWPGALVTAVLFAIGKELISLYLGLSNPASAYGAAGALVVLLIWIYYSAQILFYGAELTQLYTKKYGSRAGQGAAAEARADAKQPERPRLESSRQLPSQAASDVGGVPRCRQFSPASRAGYLAALATLLFGAVIGVALRRR